MPEDRIATPAEVMAAFRKEEPATVTYGGLSFRIRKLPATAFLHKDMQALPYVSEALGKWTTLTDEERTAKLLDWPKRKEYMDTLSKVCVLMGTVEPRFSEEDPCPADAIPYRDVDDSLKEFLALKILGLIGGEGPGFFRAGAGGEAAGAGPAREAVQPEA